MAKTASPKDGNSQVRSTSAKPTATLSNRKPTAETEREQATPVVTIRAIVVCLPDGLPQESLTATHLDRHFGVSGTLSSRFWVHRTTRLWQRGRLVGLRQGRPAYCAGGPVRLLDLAGMRLAAGVGAGIRHQVWQQAVHGTRPATPWTAYLAQHQQDPDKYPLEAVQAEFYDQPRVNAMRMHNAASYGAAQLALGELEMFQAGCVAYQHYSATTAVCGDALLTPEGHRLAPISDSFAHRVTYLERANRYLDTLGPDQRLLAVAL